MKLEKTVIGWDGLLEYREQIVGTMFWIRESFGPIISFGMNEHIANFKIEPFIHLDDRKVEVNPDKTIFVLERREIEEISVTSSGDIMLVFGKGSSERVCIKASRRT